MISEDRQTPHEEQSHEHNPTHENMLKVDNRRRKGNRIRHVENDEKGI